MRSEPEGAMAYIPDLIPAVEREHCLKGHMGAVLRKRVHEARKTP